jgi:phosphoglycolate phosphatase-like HAD superfamily hydrolase
MFIKHFHLQAVSKYARECWDFVNLYSKTRGANRFPAMVRAVKLLGERPQVKARGVTMPDLVALEDWIARETKLGNATLNAEVKNGNTGLTQVKVWSDAVNAAVAEIVHGVPPFPLVRESLQKLSAKADAMCISQTPAEALKREWAEHGIDQFVAVIAGQEMGTKTEHVKFAAAGKYAPEKILMIGDAPGDFSAAKKNGALFFPIVPGHEEDSWKRLHDEALDRFFADTYAGAYEVALVKEFDASLPERPHWQ